MLVPLGNIVASVTRKNLRQFHLGTTVPVSLGNNCASLTWNQSYQCPLRTIVPASLRNNRNSLTSEQSCNCYLGTIVPLSLAKNHASCLRPATFLKKESLVKVLSCEFCKTSNNKFFIEHLWWLLLHCASLTWKQLCQSHLGTNMLVSFAEIKQNWVNDCCIKFLPVKLLKNFVFSLHD